MPQFICIRDCLLDTPGPVPGFIRVKAGVILNRRELPNHHFVSMSDENAGMDLYAILKEKAEGLGIHVSETMDEKVMQILIAEKERDDKESGERDYFIAALTQIGVKVHTSIGMKKLRQRAIEHGIGNKPKETVQEDMILKMDS